MATSMGSLILKAPDKIPLCDPCKQIDNIETKPQFLCEICNHHLCDKCFEYHRKTLLTHNHKTVKLGESENVKSDDQVGGRRLRKTSEAFTENEPRQATFRWELNVSLRTDNVACEIKGIALLRDKIIVSDQANLKLKVFSCEYKFMFDYPCHYQPYDIETFDDTTLAVASLDGRLTFYTVGKYCLKVFKYVETPIGCLSVCYYDGEIYSVFCNIVGTGHISDICVYTLDGTLRRRFEYLSDGRTDFNSLQRIAVNPKTGILYVTDWDRGVVVLTTKGEVLTRVSSRKLKNPQGIAIDDHGQIYVCGCYSHNILKFSAAGTETAEMLTSNSRVQNAECVTVYGNKLFLGSRKSNVISIYELS